MKRIIAIILIAVMVLSLCACNDGKINTDAKAIRAAKKSPDTNLYITMRLGMASDSKIRYESAKAVDSGTEWTVTLTGTARGQIVSWNGQWGVYSFIYTAKVSYNGVVTSYAFLKTYD